jgi:hypothetical protein
MKRLVGGILVALAMATCVAYWSEVARKLLIWPLTPGLLAGVFYSAHGDWTITAWVISYVVNAICYVVLAVALVPKRLLGVVSRDDYKIPKH